MILGGMLVYGTLDQEIPSCIYIDFDINYKFPSDEGMD